MLSFSDLPLPLLTVFLKSWVAQPLPPPLTSVVPLRCSHVQRSERGRVPGNLYLQKQIWPCFADLPLRVPLSCEVRRVFFSLEPQTALKFCAPLEELIPLYFLEEMA